MQEAVVLNFVTSLNMHAEYYTSKTCCMCVVLQSTSVGVQNRQNDEPTGMLTFSPNFWKLSASCKEIPYKSRTMQFLRQLTTLLLLSPSSLLTVEAMKSKSIKSEPLLRRGKQIDYRRQLENQNSTYYGDDQNVFTFLEETYGNTQIQDDGYNRMRVTPNQMVQFRSCVPVETENYNLLLDNLVEYTKEGVLKSIKDYVLFDLCSSGECNDDDNVFMVDLGTFITATIDHGPSEREKTCEACKTYEDACASAGDGDRRHLEQMSESNCTYVLFDENTCSKCSEYNCWDDDQVDFEDIENWVSQYAECSELHYQWNNLDLYGRWTCNQLGTGMEMGVFIDPYCTMQQTQLEYTNFVQDSGYAEESQGVSDMMFQGKISCKDDDWYYLDYDSYVEMVEGGNQCQAYEDDISEACGELFYSDFVPRKASDCGSPQNIAYLLSVNGDDEYAEYDAARQTLYEANSDWYTFDISALQTLDGASTCESVRINYNKAVRAIYMTRGSIEKWIPLIAAMAIMVLVVIHVQSRRKSDKVPVHTDGYVEEKEETVQKVSRSRKHEIKSSDWAPPRQEVPDWADQVETPQSPRSLDIKKSLSRVKSLIKSRSKRVEDDEKEEPLVIIDTTQYDDDSVLQFGRKY